MAQIAGQVAGQLIATAVSIAAQILLTPDAPNTSAEGPRLDDLNVTSASYGRPIYYAAGTKRMAGNLIWSSGLQEVRVVDRHSTGSKGGGGSHQTTTTYAYYASFAVGFARGEADPDGLLKTFADSKVFFDETGTSDDVRKYDGMSIRFYPGSETQTADPTIQAAEGAANTPAHRGLCYLVIDNMPLADFGNRIPNISAIIRFNTGTDTYPRTDITGSFTSDFATSSAHPRGAMAVDRDRGMYYIAARNTPRIQRCSLDTGQVVITRDSTHSDGVVFTSGIYGLQVNPRTGDIFTLGNESSGGNPYGIKRLDPYTLDTLQEYGNDNRQAGDAYPNNGSNTDTFVFTTIPALAYDSNVMVGLAVLNIWASTAGAVMTIRDPPLTPTGPGTAEFCMFQDSTEDIQGLTIFRNKAMTAWTWPGFGSASSSTNPSPEFWNSCADKHGIVWMVGKRGNTESAPRLARFEIKRLLGDSFEDLILCTGMWRINEYEDSDIAGPSVPTDGIVGWTKSIKHIMYDELSHSLVLISGGPTVEMLRLDLATLEQQPDTIPQDGTVDYGGVGGVLNDNNYGYGSILRDSVVAAYTDTDNYLGSDDEAFWGQTKVGPQFGQFILTKGNAPTSTNFSKFRVSDLTHIKEYDVNNWENGGETIHLYSTGSNGLGMGFYNGSKNAFIARKVGSSTNPDEFVRFELDRKLAVNADLGEVVNALTQLAGLDASEIDTTDLTGVEVHGIVITSFSTARQIITLLATAFLFDGFESGSQMKYLLRGRSVDHIISEDDLGVGSGRPAQGNRVKEILQAEDLIPVRNEVVYSNPDTDYQIATQHARRVANPIASQYAQQTNAITLPIAMSDTQAKQAAEVLLYDQWEGRDGYTFNINTKFLDVDPADIITLSYNGITREVRVKATRLGGSLITGVESSSHDSEIYNGVRTGTAGLGFTDQVLALVGFTECWPADLPLIRDQYASGNFENESPQGTIYVYCTGIDDDWRGAVLSRLGESGVYSQVDSIFKPIAWGKVSGALAANQNFVSVDYANPITVHMVANTSELESVSVDRAIRGDNLAIIGTTEGGWEIISWATTTDNGDGTVTLSEPIRGRRGTDWLSTVGHGAGATFIQIEANNSIRQVYDATFDVGTTRLYRADSIGSDIVNGVARQIQLQGTQFKPYRAVNLSAVYDASDDLTITWERRTRIGGDDDWDDLVTEIPIGETAEAYEVDILDPSGNVVDTIDSLTSPTATYTSAEQVAAGLYSGDPITVVIYQLSEAVGRGYGAAVTNDAVAPITDPTDLSSLHLWLDASTTGTDGSIITSNAVEEWHDKSGNNNDFTQTSATSRPALLTGVKNSMDVVDFDGTNDRLEATTHITATAMSCFIVMNRQGGSGSATDVALDMGEYQMKARRGAGGWSVYGGSSDIYGGPNLATAGGDAAEFRICYFQTDGVTGDFTLYDDGVRGLSDTGGGGLGQGSTRLGDDINTANREMEGRMLEVIIYDRELSGTERQSVEIYLADKWGLP